MIDRLSYDLRQAFPDMSGLSARNLKYMRAFASAWGDREIVQAPLAQLTWYHHLAGRLHAREVKALNNFKRTLPPTDSDFAAQVFKDPYLFDSSAPRPCGRSTRSRRCWSRTSSASYWSLDLGSRSSVVRCR